MAGPLSSFLVPMNACVMAVVLCCKIAALVQIAWADEKPASLHVNAQRTALSEDAPVASAATSRGTPVESPIGEGPQLELLVSPPGAKGSGGRPTPTFPPDWKLLQDLRRREDAIDKRSEELDARQAALDTAQQSLEARRQGIEQRQAELVSMEESRKAQEQTGLRGLVKLYEDMRPSEAAEIFDSLDMHVLLPLLDQMNERKAAAIMGAMQPERARYATQALARYRTETPTGVGAHAANPS